MLVALIDQTVKVKYKIKCRGGTVQESFIRNLQYSIILAVLTTSFYKISMSCRSSSIFTYCLKFLRI